MSVNVLDFYGYQSTGTGKGGVTGSKTGKSGNYSANVALGLCVGPVSIGDLNSVWLDAGVSAKNRLPLNFYGGSDGQTPDSTFASSSPNTPVVGYSGLFYCTGTPMQFGKAGVLPNLSVEVNGFQTGTAGPSSVVSPDASPALILHDMLYDPRIGIGFPGRQEAFSLFQSYCIAEGLGFSLLCDKQQPLHNWIEALMELTTSAFFWSSGRIRIVPYSISQLDQNGVTYYPDLTPVAHLTDDDFLPWTSGTSHSTAGEKDPLLVTRNDVSQLTNWLTMEIMDRSYWYDPLVQPPQFDQSSLELYGMRSTSSVQAHQICSQDVGATACALMLNRKVNLRRTFKFKVGVRWMLLEPMDIVAVTDSGWALANYPVRLTAVEEDENGDLTMTAEDLV